jgi:hypothetical protein
MIHISSNSDNPKVGLYSWVTNMWEHMGPVPRVSDPTAKGSTAKDLVVKKKLSIGLKIEHWPMQSKRHLMRCPVTQRNKCKISWQDSSIEETTLFLQCRQ